MPPLFSVAAVPRSLIGTFTYVSAKLACQTSSKSPGGAAQKPLFTLSEELGSNGAIFAWSARGELVAVAGQPHAVLLCNPGGAVVDTIALPSPEFPFGDRLPSARQLQAGSPAQRFWRSF